MSKSLSDITSGFLSSVTSDVFEAALAAKNGRMLDSLRQEQAGKVAPVRVSAAMGVDCCTRQSVLHTGIGYTMYRH